LPHFICIVCSLYQCFSRRTKHIGTFLWINFSNNFMCSTRSNAFEASKNTACTDEPWVTKYEAVCFNKNVHWSVLWLALKPNWLSLVPRKGEMLDKMKKLCPSVSICEIMAYDSLTLQLKVQVKLQKLVGYSYLIA